MSDKKRIKTIIEGVTEEGQPFRPADWADRMSGSLSTFRNRRIIYSPLLQPAVKDGNRCVIIDEEELQKNHPDLYQEIMAFAQKNRLKIDKQVEDE